MKNTTIKTTTILAAAVAEVKSNNKGENKMTKFNTILTAAVINTATQMGAYVPAGLKVEMKDGKVVSNAAALIMNEMFAGKLSKQKAMIYKMDLDTAIMSAHVEETVKAVIAEEAADISVEEMVIESTDEKVAAFKAEVKDTAAAIKAFKEAKAARFAEVKAMRSAAKARRKAIKAQFKMAANLIKTTQEEEKIMRTMGIKGMNKTGFLGQARKRALAKHMSVTINTLKAKRDGGYEINVTVMNENEAIRMGFIKGETMNARCGRNSLVFDNFSKQLVLVDFSEDKTQATGLTKFYIWWNGRNTVFANLVDGVYYDLVSGKALKPRAKAPKVFEIIGGSPSSLRKDQTLAFDVTNGYGEIDKMLDAVTDGGYSKNKGKKSTTAQMSKYVTRFFAWTAPNKVIGEVTHPAIYFNKWASNKLDGMGFVSAKFYAEALSNLFNIRFTAKDVIGLSVQCRPYSAKTNAVVIDMENQFELLAAQANEIVYIEEVTPAIDKELDLAFKGKGKYANCMVVFGPEGCDVEFVSDLNGYKTEFNWGAPANFRVLDITKTEVNAIRNGANTSIQMLETPLANNPEGTFELIETLRHEQVENIFNELYVDREVKVPSLVDLQSNTHVQGIAKQIAPDYVLDKDFAMYKKVHEELFTRINKVDSKFKYAIDGCYNRIISDIACLAVEHGILQYGEAFIANADNYFFNGENVDRFMKENAKVRSCFGNRIVSMFKYPKMGVKEFYKATLLTLDTIVSRTARLVTLGDITKAQGDMIVRFYAGLKAGTIVVPSVDLLKQQCAGLDFDWDGATIVFDPRFNALLPETINITNIVTSEAKQEVVKTEKSAVKRSLVSLVQKAELNPNSGVTISAEALKEAFLAYMTSDNGGWSVGSITNTNTTQIAVLILAKSTRKRKYIYLMRDMLISWFNHEGGNGEYVGLSKRHVDLASMNDMFAFPTTEDECAGIGATVTDVSPEAVAACIESMEKADWNNPINVIRIFEDLNEIFRFYQELTIDSAKTGERVTISIAPGRKFHACMLNSNKLAWNWSRSMDESTEQDQFDTSVLTVEVDEAAPTEKKTAIHDKLFDLRREFAIDMAEMSSELLKAKDVKMALEDVAYLAKFFNNEKYLGRAGQGNKSLVGGMAKIKAIYGDLTANYIEALDAAGEDEEAINIAQIKYREGLNALRTMGRALTKDMTMTQRGAFAKFIASHRFSLAKVGNLDKLTAIVDPTGGSTFASSVFGEEYLLYITKHFAKVNFCGEKLVYNEFYVDGDVITLTNGMSEYAATTADISGEFVVREFNGKFYATKLIEDVVNTKDTGKDALVRISDADEATMAKVASALNNAGHVELRAQSVKNMDGTFTHEYGVYNAEGTKLAGLDAQGSFANVVNGKSGKIANLICGVTEFNNVRKPYILALVK